MTYKVQIIHSEFGLGVSCAHGPSPFSALTLQMPHQVAHPGASDLNLLPPSQPLGLPQWPVPCRNTLACAFSTRGSLASWENSVKKGVTMCSPSRQQIAIPGPPCKLRLWKYQGWQPHSATFRSSPQEVIGGNWHYKSMFSYIFLKYKEEKILGGI